MFRTPAILAAIGIGGLLLGGAVWLRASLASSFSRGEAYGRAVAALETATALAHKQSALELVRRDADREAYALESERDMLREKLDELEKMLAAGVNDVSGGVSPCLGAGVVRSLDAIRAHGSGAAAP
ncbi:MAG: hypothetical protein ACK4MV_01120 [Beijerinckiaceae bacterium]